MSRTPGEWHAPQVRGRESHGFQKTFEILGENAQAIDELLEAHRIDSGDERIKQKLERLLISR